MELEEQAEDEMEKIVRFTIGLTFNVVGFQNDTPLIKRVAAIVRKDSNREPERLKPLFSAEEVASLAAAAVRAELYDKYCDNRLSCVATCNLFYALDRKDELGWILKEGGIHGEWKPCGFLLHWLNPYPGMKTNSVSGIGKKTSRPIMIQPESTEHVKIHS